MYWWRCRILTPQKHFSHIPLESYVFHYIFMFTNHVYEHYEHYSIFILNPNKRF